MFLWEKNSPRAETREFIKLLTGIEGAEHLSYEETLRKLELSSLEKRRFQDDQIVDFQDLKETYKNNGEGLFTRTCSGRTRVNVFNLKEKRFRFGIRKKFIDCKGGEALAQVTPWKCSRSVGLGFEKSGVVKGWKWMIFKVTSSTSFSMVPWNCLYFKKMLELWQDFCLNSVGVTWDVVWLTVRTGSCHSTNFFSLSHPKHTAVTHGIFFTPRLTFRCVLTWSLTLAAGQVMKYISPQQDNIYPMGL